MRRTIGIVIHGEPEEISVRYSRRKTVGFRIDENGHILVNAPLRITEEELRSCVERNFVRIDRARKRVITQKNAYDAIPPFSDAECKAMRAEAKERIPARVAFFAARFGVSYGNVTIRSQKSRWGSCTSSGNLSFNQLLVLCPPEVLDSVVVHELCHRTEMNHSDRFYTLLYYRFPKYEECAKWLKTEGEVLLLRMKKTKE